MAVNAYIHNHPEYFQSSQKLQIVVKPHLTQEQIEMMIRTVFDEKTNGNDVKRSSFHIPAPTGFGVMEPAETDIDEMLNNLDLFS